MTDIHYPPYPSILLRLLLKILQHQDRLTSTTVFSTILSRLHRTSGLRRRWDIQTHNRHITSCNNVIARNVIAKTVKLMDSCHKLYNIATMSRPTCSYFNSSAPLAMFPQVAGDHQIQPEYLLPAQIPSLHCFYYDLTQMF